MITVNDVIAGLEQVVAGNEDYIYKTPESVSDENQCVYVDPATKAPSCIVGKYLIDVVGIDAETVSVNGDHPYLDDDEVHWVVYSHPADELVPKVIDDIDMDAIQLLVEAQHYQDDGLNNGTNDWAGALRAAKRYAEELDEE